MAKQPRITVQPDGRIFHTEPNRTLLEACRAAGVELEGHCAGNGACGGCHVAVEQGMENLSPLDDVEEDGLDLVPFLTPRTRLACRAVVCGDVTIRIPKR